MTLSKKNFFSLRSKNIIVTGANGFLGKNISNFISLLGGNPIMLDINTAGSKSLTNNLKKIHKNNPQFYNCDITNINKLKTISKKIFKDYKKVHGLVNNAALNPKLNNIKGENNFLENYDLNRLKKEVDVGIYGALNCIKVFGKHFSENNKGSIINVSSDLGIIAPNQEIYNDNKNNIKNVKPVSYSIVKSGIIGLTKYTSTYWAKNNVRSNAIAPGGVYENQDKNFVKKISKLIPLGRMAEPSELMGTIGFLLSDESAYITGQVISIDGGRTVW